MSAPTLPTSLYVKPREAAQILGLEDVRALYRHVGLGHIRGAERWGEAGLTARGNKRKGRLMFVRSELDYIGPRMRVAQEAPGPDPDDPRNWGRLGRSPSALPRPL